MSEYGAVGEDLMSRYPFIHYDKTPIPYQKRLTDQLSIDYHKNHNLDLRVATAAVKYFVGLNLKPKDCEGKKILDAGSGMGDFKKALQGMGVHADVMNMDDAKTFGHHYTDTVGQVEDIPFENETFDLTIVNNVFPWTIDETIDTDYMAKQLLEVIRVTKKGGTIIYRPLRMYDPNVREGSQKVMLEATTKALNALEKEYKKNPDLKINVTHADWGDDSSDDILYIEK